MLRTVYKRFHAGERRLWKRLTLSATEFPRVGNEYLLSRALSRAIESKAKGDGQGIIVIPGFLGRDNFNKPLIRFLNRSGYQATGWKQGRNLGPGNDMQDRLLHDINAHCQTTGEKVTLIGHSLGGIYARQMAHRHKDLIERVITLGSPFNRDRAGRTIANRLFWQINQKETAADPIANFNEAPPVPVTSVFTRSDSVIRWRSAVQHHGHERSENIEVYGSHCGLTLNSAVWYMLLDRLTQKSDNWSKFDNGGWRKPIYPIAELAFGNADF